ERSRREMNTSIYQTEEEPARPAVNPHYHNPLGRQPERPMRKTYSSGQLRQFERQNTEREAQPTQSRGDSVRAAAKARRDEIEARFRRKEHHNAHMGASPPNRISHHNLS